MNFLSREHGFSCDNIYGYEVVLANGSVVYASASSHSDLWLALKGGSNNFGIITRFDLATFPQQHMWGGLLLYNYTDSLVDAQAQAFSNFMDSAHFDSAADMDVILNFENGGFAIGDALFYSKPVANPEVYQEFMSLPSPVIDTIGFNNVSGMVTEFGVYLPSALNRYAFPLSCLGFKGTNDVYYIQCNRARLLVQKCQRHNIQTAHQYMGKWMQFTGWD